MASGDNHQHDIEDHQQGHGDNRWLQETVGRDCRSRPLKYRLLRAHLDGAAGMRPVEAAYLAPPGISACLTHPCAISSTGWSVNGAWSAWPRRFRRIWR